MVSIRTLKVLSVDWDYFINASVSARMKLFPDGGRELPPQIGDYVWLTHYADMQLKNIDILNQDLKSVADVIKNCSDCKIVICDSHVHCYRRVCEMMCEAKNLILYNIDFHSDVYTSTLHELNCGNWLHHIIKEYPNGKYFWINSKLSDEKVQRGMISKLKQVNISKINNLDFDLVFICRSALWSPPHLDHQFINFCSNFKNRATILEPYALIDRFSPAFIRNLSDYKNMLSNITKK